MFLADTANKYIDDKKPWKLAKEPGKENEVQVVCSTGIQLFRIIMIYLKPVLPNLAIQTEKFLNDELKWPANRFDKQIGNILYGIIPLFSGHTIKPFEPLMQRIEKEKVDAMIEEEKRNMPAQAPAPTQTVVVGLEPLAPTISIDDFMKIDLRVAKIVDAKHVEGADKLLQLTLDLGGDAASPEQRNVFSGIKSAYQPEQLVGRLTVVVANLAPRKMKFGVSEGMVLAAGPGGKDIFLLSPDSGAQAGMRIK
jgi:methionyl-tRNA synthetase